MALYEITPEQFQKRQNLAISSIDLLKREIILNPMNCSRETLVKKSYILKGYLDICLLLGVISFGFQKYIKRELLEAIPELRGSERNE